MLEMATKRILVINSNALSEEFILEGSTLFKERFANPSWHHQA